MIVTEPKVEILTEFNGVDVLKHLEQCGRVCYKSEGKITDDSYIPFLTKIIQRGHEAVLEHFSITVKFVCDRGVSHEIVRHRIASYCQESTRYCNYSKDIFSNNVTFIKPCYWKEDDHAYKIWEHSCRTAESCYFALLDNGCTPQEARAVLPNSLKTEIVMTANLREWRHFLKLRCAPAAHPQMREVANLLRDELKRRIPIIFDDID